MNRHPSGYYYPQKLSGAKIFTNCPIYLGPLPLGNLLAENVELVAKESNNQKSISELQTNISKITSELDICESENAELIIANEELDRKEELEDKIGKNKLLIRQRINLRNFRLILNHFKK